MITNYSESAFYDIYQRDSAGKQRKIAIIHENICYDVDIKGKRIGNGFAFSNTENFWRQFGTIQIKKTERPLGGFEPIVWGIYWTMHVLGTIIAVVAVPESEKIYYLVISAFVLAMTVKYRYNKLVLYLMAAVSIIFVIFLLSYKPAKK